MKEAMVLFSKSIFRDGQFHNPYQYQAYPGILNFLLWRLGYYRDRIRPNKIPKGFTYPNEESAVDFNKPCVAWVNHSTFWVQAYGKNLLLDPIWAKRCSPFSFWGPKRLHPPSFSISSLQQVDYVLISHNHYDHLDKKTLETLQYYYPDITYIVPLGVKKWLVKHISPKAIFELDWWETLELGPLTFTGVPAQHFSGRHLWDRNRSLWMGCVVQFHKEKQLYFAGDSGYNPFQFKEIGKYFKQIDLSLIPIGVYLPRRFMKPIHINPYESIQIHQDVNSTLSIGGHWGTFRLSSEKIKQPLYDLYTALKEKETPFEDFRVLKPGQFINW